MSKLNQILKQIHKSGYNLDMSFSDYTYSGKMRFRGFLYGQLTGIIANNYRVSIDDENFKSVADVANRALDIICKNEVSGKYITR